MPSRCCCGQWRSEWVDDERLCRLCARGLIIGEAPQTQRQGQGAETSVRVPRSSNLPGGRKAEIVREADPDGRPAAHARTVDTIDSHAQGWHHHGRHARCRARLPGPFPPSPPTTPHHPGTWFASRAAAGRTILPTTKSPPATGWRARSARWAGSAAPAAAASGTWSGWATACANGRCSRAGEVGPMYGNHATGVLITALGVLAVHYGYGPAKR